MFCSLTAWVSLSKILIKLTAEAFSHPFDFTSFLDFNHNFLDQACFGWDNMYKYKIGVSYTYHLKIYALTYFVVLLC